MSFIVLMTQKEIWKQNTMCHVPTVNGGQNIVEQLELKKEVKNMRSEELEKKATFVYYRNFGALYLSLIVPWDRAEQASADKVWLCREGRADVEVALRVQGLNPRDYIGPAVDPYGYVKMHQGVICALVTHDLTKEAAPEKPVPASFEVSERLFYLLSQLLLGAKLSKEEGI